MKNRSRTYGFTLVELLVVIAIIAILATLVNVGMKGARMAANKTEAIQKINTVGRLLFNYTADNNGRLPGPLRGYQKPAKFPANFRSLLFHIEKYYGDGFSYGYDMDPRFVPKAYYRWLEGKGLTTANLQNANVYVMYNNKQNLPWGLPGSTVPVEVASSNMYQFLSDKGASSTVVLRDAIGPGSGLMPEEDLLYKGVHILYFDGHIESVTIKTLPAVSN